MKLEKVMAKLNSEKEIEHFLRDLLSQKEYESLKERWRVWPNCWIRDIHIVK